MEDERTFLENLHLSRLIKENHGECLIECCFFKSEIKDIYNPTNLLAVIGGKQANIYDNEHCGTHLDIMSQFNCDQNLVIVYSQRLAAAGSKWNMISGWQWEISADRFIY